ncbi:MAG TPA: tRNA lysidine(34) synthetase TilS [Chlamydiales bacterium]|nr:tRNA lysidine(34) synthetase TilS [Chlamydiales bacterium]
MKRVKDFLKVNWDKKSPVLLGYSGGPDSKALLYALLEYGCNTLCVAHVDHGWREESAKEELQIRKEIEDLKLPYFSTRLNAVEKKEDAARFARLAFFRSLFAKTSFQALILGHQADDLAETILKRLFEGTHLPFLGGMTPISQFEGMPVWRPLLKIPKRDLISYLALRNLKPFYDPTNQDPVYLRSRMRIEMLPFLDQSFGKNIRENLCILAERAAELKEYLDKRVAQRMIESEGISFEGLERIERRHLLQRIATKEKISLTRTVLEQLLDWVDDRKIRKIYINKKWIFSGKGMVFVKNQLLT